MKPTRCTNFSKEFFTVRSAMVYVIQVCW